MKIYAVLAAALLSPFAWGGEKPTTKAGDASLLTLSAFTMKSSDGSMSFKMDESGKLFLGEQHIATAHTDGRLMSPADEVLLRLNNKGVLVDKAGRAFEDPIAITADGTWKQGDASLAWEAGTFSFGRLVMTIAPEDSASKRIAAMAIAVLAGGPDNSLRASEQPFGDHTLRIEPTPMSSRSRTTEDSVTFTADENRFELKDGVFWFNGESYGKLNPGSDIRLKNGVLTIDGAKPAKPQ